MSLDAWNLLVSAGICALLIVGGFWLKYFVDQQIKSLNAIIQLKDAEISTLRSDIAPAITRAYNDMRQHADTMTQDVQRISEELKKVQKKYETSLHVLDLETESTNREKRGARAFYESNGLLLAIKIISEKFGSLSRGAVNNSSDLVNKVMDTYDAALELIHSEIHSRYIQTADLLTESLEKGEPEGNGGKQTG